MGESGSGWLASFCEGCENDNKDEMDQTWRFESHDPDMRKLKVGSTARHVTG